jgi:hypothetical protein
MFTSPVHRAHVVILRPFDNSDLGASMSVNLHRFELQTPEPHRGYSRRSATRPIGDGDIAVPSEVSKTATSGERGDEATIVEKRKMLGIFSNIKSLLKLGKWLFPSYIHPSRCITKTKSQTNTLYDRFHESTCDNIKVPIDTVANKQRKGELDLP